MPHFESIQDIFQKEKILGDEDTIQAITEEAKRKHVDFEEVIANKKHTAVDAMYQLTAKFYGVDYINLQDITLQSDLIDLLPETIVQTHQIVVFERDQKKGTLSIATREPDDIQTIDFIQKKTGLKINIFYTDSASIQHIVQQYHKTLEQELQNLTAAPLSTDSYTGLKELNRVARDVPIIKMVDVILHYAIYEGASDIHVEPTEKEVIVRYRIDGILFDVMTLPKALQQAVVARIKVLSNLKIDEHRLPQDGRFKIETNQKKVAFRVSIFPVYDGEKMVLRILDESAKVLTFEQLGMQKQRLEVVRSNIQKPHGMVLVTGPTGSGKTTTLYSVLNVLNTPKVNISTVEDPIEYRIPRVNQAQVSPKIGFTFAMGLRALLRQDPNIIMVGEIRDTETAEIAAHAAMTGHLVLSTLHTNDAIGTIARFAEMGIPRYLISSTVNLIIAQRLVRKICEHCRVTVAVTKELIAEIEQQMKFADIMEVLTEYGELEKGTEVTDIHFFRGKGCAKCGHRGYKGRIGIYEILEMTPGLSQLVLQQASPEEMMKRARDEGMMTMAQDGFLKAKQGLTSIEEILRVAKE